MDARRGRGDAIRRHGRAAAFFAGRLRRNQPRLSGERRSGVTMRRWRDTRHNWPRHGFSAELKKAGSEQYFNEFEPFYKAMVLYVCAFLLVLGYWFRPVHWDWARLAAVGLVALALAGPHRRAALPDVFGRPPARDEPLFLRHFHRLGRGACWDWCWNGSGETPSARWSSCIHRVCDPDHRASSARWAATPWK